MRQPAMSYQEQWQDTLKHLSVDGWIYVAAFAAIGLPAAFLTAMLVASMGAHPMLATLVWVSVLFAAPFAVVDRVAKLRRWPG